jgi:Icc-related predicted phosphoesterase
MLGISAMVAVVRVVCLADTHLRHEKVRVPDGDVALFAGDMCLAGRDPRELREWADWFGKLPHKHVIAIAGNHDWLFQTDPELARFILESRGVTYLQDQEVVIEGVKFWGSPWQPDFMDWAFNLPRGPRLAEKWALIPDDIDVLITHGPPYGILDPDLAGRPAGCEDLRSAVLHRVKPKLHVFGHLHSGYGQAELRTGATRTTRFVNASTVNERYEPLHPPIAVDL